MSGRECRIDAAGIITRGSGIKPVKDNCAAECAASFQEECYMRKRTLLLVSLVVVLIVGWYLFRPERLFVNAKVSETFPSTAGSTPGASAGSPIRLVSGSFHSIAPQDFRSCDGLQTAGRQSCLAPHRLRDFQRTGCPCVSRRGPGRLGQRHSHSFRVHRTWLAERQHRRSKL